MLYVVYNIAAFHSELVIVATAAQIQVHYSEVKKIIYLPLMSD